MIRDVCTIFCALYILVLVRNGFSFLKGDWISLIYMVIVYAKSH